MVGEATRPLLGSAAERRAQSAACPVAQDTIFLVDTSASVGQNALVQLKSFLAGVLQGLPVPPVNVGLVRFGDYTTDQLSPLSGDRNQLLLGISGMTMLGGGTSYAPALQLARNVLAASTRGKQSVVIIAAGMPNDEAATRVRAAELQAVGVRLLFVWIGGGSAPALLGELASPSGGAVNVFFAPTFQSLGGIVGSVVTAVIEPCPCPRGAAVALVGPGNVTAVLRTSGTLPNAGTEAQDCAAHFPGTSGAVTLLCSDGRLQVSHTCALACQQTSSLRVDVDGVVGTAMTSGPMASGAVEIVPCGAVVPGSTGSVRLECFQGVVTASHSCGRGCAGGVVVPVVGAAPGNGSSQFRVPQAGLSHGSWSTQSCELHFGGTTGSLGVLCLGGQPRVFGQCTPAPPGEALVECPSEIVVGMGILGSVGILSLCLGLMACAYVLYRQRQVEPVVPLSRLEAIVPVAPPPPPPPVVKRVVTVEQQTSSKECEAVEAQTLPQVYAELVRGCQMPLDLVCCIDSGYSVGEDGFGKCISFLEAVVQSLEMPPVQVGILQFNHGLAVASEMSSNAPGLLRCLSDLTYQLGGKKLGPALRKAGEMLLAGGSALACRGDQPRKKAVLVLMDSETNDLNEAAQEVATLKRYGVLVLFVIVGEQAPPHSVMMLASEPADLHVMSLRSYNELPSACEKVLERVVDVAMWVRRAKCLVDLPSYQEVTDIDCVPGYEIMVPGWQPKDPYQWAWEPQHGRCLQDPQITPWDKSYLRCGPAPPPPRLPDAQTQTFIAALCDGSIQTDCVHAGTLAVQTDPEIPPQVFAAGVQTDPVVKVSLEASRHAPLDLVVCMHSWASPKPCHVCLQSHPVPSVPSSPRGGRTAGGSPTDDEAMERTKDFIDYLATCVDMPEVRLALVCFKELSRVQCDFTGERRHFKDSLQEVQPMDGDTRLAPPLRQALALLSSRTTVGPVPAGKAVLVITDDSPCHCDQEEAAQVSSNLRDMGAQLLFVKIARSGGRTEAPAAAALKKLAAPGQRLPRMGSPPSESPQAPRGLFECEDDAQAMRQLVPEVMRQLISVTQRVARARCAIPLDPYELITGDIANIDGEDILLQEGVPILHEGLVQWEQWMLREPAAPLVLAQEIQTEDTDCTTRPMQTDPVLKVELTPWRHAPLDLVVCLDNSASFGLERGGDASSFVQSKTFARAKAFLESLASAVHMPEVRLALLRLDDTPGELSALTASQGDFRAAVQELEPSAGKAAFAPSMRQALRMLDVGRIEGAAAGARQDVAKAVLVVTDAEPADLEDALQAAAQLRERGAQVLFVKVLKDVGSPRLLPASARFGEGGVQEQEMPWSTLQTMDSPQAFQQLVPDVLRQLVQVTQRIRRAWCTLPVQQLVGGGWSSGPSGFLGHEVRLPEDVPVLVPECVPWDPAYPPEPSFVPDLPAYYTEEIAKSRAGVEEMRRQVEEARCEARRCQEALEKREQEWRKAEEERKAQDEERRKAEDERRAADAEHLRKLLHRHEEEKQAIEAARDAQEAERRAAEADKLCELVKRHEDEKRAAAEVWRLADEGRSTAEAERRAADEQRFQELKEQFDQVASRAEEAEAKVLEFAKHVEERNAQDEERTAAEGARDEARRLAEEEGRAASEERRAADEARALELQTKLVEVTRHAEEAGSKAREYKKRMEEAEREKDSKSRDFSRRVREMDNKMSDLTRTVSQLRAELSSREAQDSLREAEFRAKASESRAMQATAERKAEVLQLRLEQAELEVKTFRAGSTQWRVDGKVRAPNLDRSLQVAEGAIDVAKNAGANLQDHAHAITSAVDGLSHILARAVASSRPCSPRGNSGEPLYEPSPGSSFKRSTSRDRSVVWRSSDLGECMEWVRSRLEEREGSIEQAFTLFDTNKTGRITCGETIAALELHVGLSKNMAAHVFRRLTQLARCERKGCLTKQDWIVGFAQGKASSELVPAAPMLPLTSGSTTSAREAGSSTILQLEGDEKEISC